MIDISGEASGRVLDITAEGAAEITGVSLFDLPEQRGTRMTFLLNPRDRDSIDLRLVVREPLADRRDLVWLHRWTRARDGGA